VDSQSVNLIFAEVEISFDGYPPADASSSPYFERSFEWAQHHGALLIYDAPFISAFDLGATGAFKSTLMYTGEGDPRCKVGFLMTLESTAPSGKPYTGCNDRHFLRVPSRGVEPKYLIQFCSTSFLAVAL
jgi:hypothetical protein